MNWQERMREVRKKQHEAMRSLLADMKEDMISWVAEGFTHVAWHYEGSGDSGGIEAISLIKYPEMALHEAYDSMWELTHHLGDDQVRTLGFSYDTPVSRIGEMILEQVGVDYYNNDGGFGVLIMVLAGNGIDTHPGMYWANTNIRVMDTHVQIDDGDLNKIYDEAESEN